MRTKNH